MKILINENFIYLNENYEIAKKYFIGDNFSIENLDYVKSVCKFPQYLSVYAWVYINSFRFRPFESVFEELNLYYENNDILKILEFTDPIKIVKTPYAFFGELLTLLSERRKYLEKLKLIDPTYIRNIKKFLKGPFSLYELKLTMEKLYEIFAWINTYEDYPESDLKTKILNTAFSSKATSLRDISNFLQDSYEEDLHFKNISSVEELKDIIDEQSLNVKILYEKDETILVKVNDHESLRSLTCNSKFCFSRSRSYKDWSVYASGDYVFLLFNFQYSFPDYLTAILPHLYAYDANNLPIGGDEADSRKYGIKLLKKYVKGSQLKDYLEDSKYYLESYKQKIRW